MNVVPYINRPAPFALPYDALLSHLFIDDQRGFLSRLSDTTTLYQDSAGTTPVTGPGQQEGLVLDTRLWGGKTLEQVLAGQDQLVHDPDIEDTNWLLTAGWSLGAGTVIVTSAANNTRFQIPVGLRQTFVVGDRAEIIFTVDSISEGAFAPLFATRVGPQISSPGTYTCILDAASTVGDIGVRAVGTTSGVISYLSAKIIPGNHAPQSTSAARAAWYDTPYPQLRPDGGDDNYLTTALLGSTGNSLAAKVTVPATLSATQVVMGASGSGAARFFIGFNTSGHLVGGVGSDSVDTVLHAVDYRSETGVIGLTEDGSNWRLYWNGAEVASGAQNGAPTTTIPLRLCALNNNGTAGSFTSAAMGDTLAIDRALTPKEMQLVSKAWS